jgi:hypothetical protein
MNVPSLEHPIVNNSKHEKSSKHQKRKLPFLCHIWLQMFIMNSGLSKLTSLKWVPCVSIYDIDGSDLGGNHYHGGQ